MSPYKGAVQRINDTSKPINLCGNGKCDKGENYTSCPKDCKKPSGGGGGNEDCTPQCVGKQCGGDGCGGNCLPGCIAGYECNSAGNCAQLINCTVDSNCSYLTGVCGKGLCNQTIKQCYAYYNLSTVLCRNNVSECDAAEMCTGNSVSCTNDANKSDETTCSSGICINGKCVGCTPQCSGKQCGNNGCGGNCLPGCSSGQSCNSTGGCEAGIINLTNNISQYGITWYFDKQYEYGTFANGDYWVIGPVTFIRIDPPSLNESGRIKNGAMINPSPLITQQGYDNQMPGIGYNNTLNAAYNVSSINPLTLQTDSSLISSISVDAPQQRPQLKSAAILTVLDSIPSEGSFRPGYTNISKDIKFNKNQLNYSLLKKLPLVTGTPALSTVERYFERPWIDHSVGWSAEYTHPVDNMPSYPRDMATQVSEGALMLHLNFTDLQKEKLLIEYTQLGIDYYSIIKDNGKNNWINNGGHAAGRKWSILFAGLVLNDAEMRNIGQKSGDYLYSGSYGPGNVPSDYIHFGEDDQTHYVTNLDIAINPHTPDYRDTQIIEYSSSDLGLPEWGIRHATDPILNNKWWSTNYRICCNGISWGGSALAAHIMNAEDLWNHHAFFDFQDRYMEVQNDSWRQWGNIAGPMWDAYRKDYGCSWARDNSVDAYSNGHYNCSDYLVRCSWQNSTVGSLVSQCSQYFNQRACNYDPCNLKNCSWSETACVGQGSISTEKPKISSENIFERFFSWFKELFS